MKRNCEGNKANARSFIVFSNVEPSVFGLKPAVGRSTAVINLIEVHTIEADAGRIGMSVAAHDPFIN